MVLSFTDRHSPNFNDRRDDAPVDMLLLHYTQMDTAEDALNRMCDPQSEVSAHYLVDVDGTIFRLVAETKRAWHAGLSNWAGVRDVNSLSIGLEIANGGHEAGLPAYPDAQMEAVIALSKDICARHDLHAERVLGHSDVAPDRKEDPGEHFNWASLAEQGVGLWPLKDHTEETGRSFGLGDESDILETFQNDLVRFGYWLEPTGVYGRRMEKIVIAFQRHFRPQNISGAVDPQTRALLKDILNQI